MLRFACIAAALALSACTVSAADADDWQKDPLVLKRRVDKLEARLDAIEKKLGIATVSPMKASIIPSPGSSVAPDVFEDTGIVAPPAAFAGGVGGAVLQVAAAPVRAAAGVFARGHERRAARRAGRCSGGGGGTEYVPASANAGSGAYYVTSGGGTCSGGVCRP